MKEKKVIYKGKRTRYGTLWAIELDVLKWQISFRTDYTQKCANKNKSKLAIPKKSYLSKMGTNKYNDFEKKESGIETCFDRLTDVQRSIFGLMVNTYRDICFLKGYPFTYDLHLDLNEIFPCLIYERKNLINYDDDSKGGPELHFTRLLKWWMLSCKVSKYVMDAKYPPHVFYDEFEEICRKYNESVIASAQITKEE